MSVKIIDGERKIIRKELKSIKNVKSGIILIVEELNKPSNKITYLLDEVSKIYPYNITQYESELDSQVKMNDILMKSNNGKIVITNIILNNGEELLTKLKEFEKNSYFNFLNKMFLIIK